MPYIQTTFSSQDIDWWCIESIVWVKIHTPPSLHAIVLSASPLDVWCVSIFHNLWTVVDTRDIVLHTHTCTSDTVCDRGKGSANFRIFIAYEPFCSVRGRIGQQTITIWSHEARVQFANSELWMSVLLKPCIVLINMNLVCELNILDLAVHVAGHESMN